MKDVIKKAIEIVATASDRYLLLQQLNNPTNPEIHTKITGPKIWQDTNPVAQ